MERTLWLRKNDTVDLPRSRFRTLLFGLLAQILVKTSGCGGLSQFRSLLHKCVLLA